MAGLAATRLFSAGGAGGIVLTYWALRKAGMPRKETAARMVAFLVLLYAVYMLTLLINGILLSSGVFDGPAPAGPDDRPGGDRRRGDRDLPADGAGPGRPRAPLLVGLAGEVHRADRCAGWRPCRRPRRSAPARRCASSASPSRGGLAVVGAIGFWAAQIGILWASFKAFGVEVPLAVVVQGFFVGMVANLIPLPGRGRRRRRGMIGAFALFGVQPRVRARCCSTG